MSIEGFNSEPVVPDESEIIDNKFKAERMAHSSDDQRTWAAELSRQSKEGINSMLREQAVRQKGFAEIHADEFEDIADILYELEANKRYIPKEAFQQIKAIIDQHKG